MAELNITLEEIIPLVKRFLDDSSYNIKELDVKDDNKVRLVLSVSKLLPDITLIFSYRSFERGIIKFHISTKYPAKTISSFINNMEIEGLEKDMISMEGEFVYVRIKEIMNTFIPWLEVNNIRLVKNKFIISMNIESDT